MAATRTAATTRAPEPRQPPHEPETPRHPASGPGSFSRRVVVAVAIAALAFLLWQLRHVVVLGIASVVVAAMLAGAAGLIRRILPIGHRAALALAGILVVGALAAVMTLAWPQMADQADAFLDQFNRSINQLEEEAGFSVEDLVEGLRDGGGSALGRVFSDAFTLATSVASAATGIVLVVVAGAFIAARPGLYRDGLILLVPPRYHRKAREALDRTGLGLGRWLVGQVISMTIIGLLVGIGAWAIGLPSPLVLGLIAGITEFVPLIGPIAGAMVGLLFAFTVDGPTFLWTLLLYLAVQQVESNLITPIVQRKAVSVPPAVFMLSVVAMGTLFGIVGVLLSGPLTVMVYALVRAIYVEGALGEELESESGI